MPTPTPLLAVRGLEKTYPAPGGPLHVIRGLDWELAPGRLVAIVGASGAGKSTLLHILGTLDRPTAGTVHFGGDDVFRLPAAELARFRNRSVGFVFQFHHLVPELTARENVMLPGWMAGREGYELETAARELLDEVGVGARAEHRPSELSGGEQQRVAVARALVNQPLLLLADEPTGNLDIPTGEALHALFARLVRERGQTTVVATHNPRLAERAEAVYRMSEGVLVPVSEPAAGQGFPESSGIPEGIPGATSSGEGREWRP